jgi:hypothetical protein
MTTISKKSTAIFAILVLMLIFGISIVSAQNRNDNNGPSPSGGQTKNQNQNQTCTNDCPANPVQNQAQNGPQNQNQSQNNLLDCPNCPINQSVELPEAVIAAMQAGLLDEYTAYAIYSSIIEQFGEIAPFVNIQLAESRHIWVWERMFDLYSLELPESPVVDIPIFDTVRDACAYALELEIANGDLYQELLTSVADYRNLTQLLSSLQSASLNHHLPALETCAAQ